MKRCLTDHKFSMACHKSQY